jgi:predicted PurR-regulated permease PerM
MSAPKAMENPVNRNIEKREAMPPVHAVHVEVTPPTWAQTRVILRVIALILFVAGALWIIYKLKSVILLVVLSIFFAYLIAPLVELVQRPLRIGGSQRAMPRALAIGIVYLAIFGALGIVGYFLVPRFSNQFTSFVQQAPKYMENTRTRARGLQELYRRLQLPPAAAEAFTEAGQRAIASIENFARESFGGVLGALAYVPWFVLIPIIAFFLLKDAPAFREMALKALPRGRIRWRGDELFQDINETLAAYIRAQLTACLLIGIFCSIGFALIGVPYALVFGVIAGLFEFIPLAGPLVVLLLTAIVTGFTSIPHAIAVVIFLIVLRLVQDYVIYPRIIGHGIHLHPLAVVLAILCGDEIAGLAGIFLAIPVVAVISVVYRHWLEHRGSEGLVADLLQPVEEIASPAPPAVTETATDTTTQNAAPNSPPQLTPKLP